MITKDDMVSLGSGLLISAFMETYVAEYDYSKLKNVMVKVGNSKKGQHLFTYTMNTKKIPSVKIILENLNLIPFFLFSKAETLCLGALTILNASDALIREIRSKYFEINEGIYGDNDITDDMDRQDELDSLIVEAIISCQNLKVMTGKNFFDRFYTRLEMIKSAGKNNYRPPKWMEN